MPRKTASAFVSAVALAACCLAAPAAALATEEAMAGDFAPVEVEVRGLSPDDLLNIRATASPITRNASTMPRIRIRLTAVATIISTSVKARRLVKRVRLFNLEVPFGM